MRMMNDWASSIGLSGFYVTSCCDSKTNEEMIVSGRLSMHENDECLESPLVSPLVFHPRRYSLGEVPVTNTNGR